MKGEANLGLVQQVPVEGEDQGEVGVVVSAPVEVDCGLKQLLEHEELFVAVRRIQRPCIPAVTEQIQNS